MNIAMCRSFARDAGSETRLIHDRLPTVQTVGFDIPSLPGTGVLWLRSHVPLGCVAVSRWTSRPAYSLPFMGCSLGAPWFSASYGHHSLLQEGAPFHNAGPPALVRTRI